ncbi:MAG: DUF2911 domain-containing protein [Acidimicrobiia bacterium]|nr:DUF2911 domain-containing protein [Acidimicrobiia bacterium]
MKTTLATVLMAGVAVAGLTALQKTTAIHPGMGGSPHVRTDWAVAGATISIEYGRPYLKGRSIERQLVPAGRVWRAGADQATTLKSDKTLRFGSLSVPAGTYTLFVMPSADKWQLIVNKQTGQWGTEYTQSQDLGRVDMKLETLSSPVEQHTFAIAPQGKGGVLSIEWGTVKASVPFDVVQ